MDWDEAQESLPLEGESLTPDTGNLPEGDVIPAEGEKRDAPPPSDPRWDKVYARMKEAERERDDIRRQNMESAAAMEELRRHNESLRQFIEEQRGQRPDPLDEARTRMESLLEEGDTKGAQKLSIEIAKEEMRREMQQQAQKAQQAQANMPPQLDPRDAARLELFREQNTDLFDNKSRNAALREHHMDIAQDPRWASRPLKDRLDEAARRTRHDFGIQSKPTLGDGIGSLMHRPSTPTLTPEEAAVARKFFPGDPNAEKLYLAEKVKMAQKG